MNIIFETSRYILFIIIGIILIIWYWKKKGWDVSFKLSLIFIIIWKTLIFFIFLGIDLLIEEYWITSYYFYDEIIYLLIMIFRFFSNIFLGIIFLKIIYKQKMQESIVIILMIVIIEIILENIILLLYPFLYFLT
jgi:hypothetical protein